jgi:DNA gyrase subunit B
MREIVDHGYLYVAQPPLFKVKRGNSEVYLKDEASLIEHVITNATNNASLVSKAGAVRTGEDLTDFVRKLHKYNMLLHSIAKIMPIEVAGAASFADGFNQEWIHDAEKAKLIGEAIAKILQETDVQSDECRWYSEVDAEGNIVLKKEIKGVTNIRVLTSRSSRIE